MKNAGWRFASCADGEEKVFPIFSCFPLLPCQLPSPIVDKAAMPDAVCWFRESWNSMAIKNKRYLNVLFRLLVEEI